jgi:two-component system, NarL family, sensor kinase
MNGNGNSTFKLTRYYAVASFVGIVAATAILTLFFRQLAIQDIVSIAENTNVNLARTALNSAFPELDQFLAKVQSVGPHAIVEHKVSGPLASALTSLMHDTSVVRLKIYNRQGVVVYSTKPEQIGDAQENNGGFASAIAGKIKSNLIYRDTFNSFDRETEEDNLLATYVPVRSDPISPIKGVIEIYTDVTPLVMRNERTVLIILVGIGLILMLLYIGLLVVVGRSTRVIDSQQQIIRDRTAVLEMLSAQKLKNEETEKRQIATDLHEGLVQTLSAAKFRLEAGIDLVAASEGSSASLKSVIPVLQGAIEEIEEIATGLRPSSLDELGLLPTIDRFCRDFEATHPGIQIKQNVSLEKDETPQPLRIVVYRIIESVLKNIAQHETADRVELELRRADRTLTLVIDEAPQDLSYRAPSQRKTPVLQERFAEAYQRTMLSGGMFSVTYNDAGGATLFASWELPNAIASLSDAEPAQAAPR